MSQPVLSIEGLTSGYGLVTVLRGVSLEVRDHEIVALLGANGGGKSTLLKTIAGLLVPTAGDVRLNGVSLIGKTPEAVARAGIVLVPEGRQLFMTMTVRENLMLGAYMHRRDRKQLRVGVERILDLFPALREKLTVQCQNLSGGQQQMVAIGRALMAQPNVLLLDEPSLGLAPLVLKEVFDAIAGLRQAGVTVLIIEQNAVMTLQLADRGYVMVRGAMTMTDTAQNLLHDSRIAESYLGAALTATDTNTEG